MSSGKIAEFAGKQFEPFAPVIGIDIGSRAAKAVLLYGDTIYTSIQPTGMYMQQTAEELKADLLEQAGLKEEDIVEIAGTGYGRIALSSANIKSFVISEISAHGMGTNFLNPKARTIIDIGGQDSKAIKIDPDTGKVLEFIMNDKCAAGTGRFLEKTANILGYDFDDLAGLRPNPDKEITVSSQCVVFAESEVISLRAKGEDPADILAAVHLAAAKRVCTLLKRVKIEPEIVFSGGVSNNIGMRRALEKLLGVTIKELPFNMSFAGALGAAIYAEKEGRRQKEEGAGECLSADLSELRESVSHRRKYFIEKKDDVKRVGYICSYTPLELLEASGVAHARIMHAGSNREVSVGEMLTTSVFCDFTKSCLGAFETKNAFTEALDRVYMFDTCNPMKKTVEVINEKYRTAGIYLLPRCRSSENVREFFRGEIVNFKEDLEKLTGRPISEEDVRREIKSYNRVRKLLRQISELRKRNAPPIRGSQFLELIQAYYSLPPRELIPLLERIYEKLSAVEDTRNCRLRVMMAGGIVAEGDRKIIDILENDFQVQIVVEDHCTGINPVYYDVEEEGDAYAALANGYLDSAPCARMVPLEKRIEHSDRLAKEYEVDAVIYKYLKFCPCYGLARNSYLKHFQEQGIPILEIASDYSEGDEGQIKTRIEAFVEVLKEKKR